MMKGEWSMPLLFLSYQSGRARNGLRKNRKSGNRSFPLFLIIDAEYFISFYVIAYFQTAFRIRSSTMPTPVMMKDTAVLHLSWSLISVRPNIPLNTQKPLSLK